MNLLTHIWLTSGELDRVMDLGETGLEASKTRGELWARSYLLNALAQATWQRGERQHAEVLAREGASCSRALDDRAGLAVLLETLAWMAAEQAAYERAATLLGCTQHTREVSAFIQPEPFRPQHTRSAGLAIEGLGQTAFDVAVRRNRPARIRPLITARLVALADSMTGR